MFKRFFRRAEPGEDQAERLEREQAKVEEGLSKSRQGLLTRLGEVFGPVNITEETWEALELKLIQSDVGVATSVAMVEDLREQARYAGVRRASELPAVLRAVMIKTLEKAGAEDLENEAEAAAPPPKPFVLLMVGVNGGGKTTTIAKLAHRNAAEGNAVALVAADTFRAAAIDQLATWAERVGVPIVKGVPQGDPGAVAYDAMHAGVCRTADLVLVDTAGRLHTQKNLMQELRKVRGVLAKEMPGAPHATLLVLDATTGQNGLAQAKAFMEAVEVTGLVLAKLDSSAKGGIAFAVARELGLPILYVGLGEGLDDLVPFDAAHYVDALLGAEEPQPAPPA